MRVWKAEFGEIIACIAALVLISVHGTMAHTESQVRTLRVLQIP